MKKYKQGFSGDIGTLTPLYDKQGKPRYNRGLLWYHIPLFEYLANVNDPLIYTDKNGTQYSLDRHFETDGGSIPPACRVIPFANLDPLNFPRAYLFHDSTYQYGGMYVRYKGETDFKFRLFTRNETDDFIVEWLYYDNANWFTRRIVANGLLIGSRFVWDDDKWKKQKAERVKERINVYDKNGFIIEDNSKK